MASPRAAIGASPAAAILQARAKQRIPRTPAPRGSLLREPSIIQVDGLVRASFEGDPMIPSEWGQVAKWTLKMPSRVAASFGVHVEGDYSASGLVDGYPLYQRVAHDGDLAMIGFDASTCLAL